METSPAYPEELDLKGKTETELLESLLEGNIRWNEDEKALITSAYSLACSLHEPDRHKEKPYHFHLLRVSNRITGYLHIADAEVVAAALLHDSVEDHAAEIVSWAGLTPLYDKTQVQKQALRVLANTFSPRVSDIVSYVTNPPDTGERLTYRESLRRYYGKVYEATRPIEGWLVKFPDWCDNGVGIVHGEKREPRQLEHFGLKYGIVLGVFEQRFYDKDIQALLDPLAKAYVEKQLTLGRERLEEDLNLIYKP